MAEHALYGICEDDARSKKWSVALPSALTSLELEVLSNFADTFVNCGKLTFLSDAFLERKILLSKRKQSHAFLYHSLMILLTSNEDKQIRPMFLRTEAQEWEAPAQGMAWWRTHDKDLTCVSSYQESHSELAGMEWQQVSLRKLKLRHWCLDEKSFLGDEILLRSLRVAAPSMLLPFHLLLLLVLFWSLYEPSAMLCKSKAHVAPV